MYARAVQIDGNIYNGTVQQIPDSGPLALNTPTAGAIEPERRLDAWTFFGGAAQMMTIIVDPGSGAASGPLSPTLGWVQVQTRRPPGQCPAHGRQHGNRVGHCREARRSASAD